MLEKCVQNESRIGNKYRAKKTLLSIRNVIYGIQGLCF